VKPHSDVLIRPAATAPA